MPATASVSRSKRVARRPRGSLSRDEILEVGLRIARTEELSRVTMKKLAAELGVTPMAMYRHFRNKAELIDGILDHFVRDAAVTGHGVPHEDWQRWVALTFGEMRRALVETPGVMPFLSTATRFGPGAMGVLDETLGVLRGAGLGRRAAVDAFLVLCSYTIGAAGMEAAWRRPPEGEPAASASGDEQPGIAEVARRSRARLESASRDEFPNVVDAAADLASSASSYPFELGLRLLLESLDREGT